jgi:hypothetical protein
MRFYIFAMTALSAACVAVAASAHHSGAMYDSRKTLEVAATVKQFQWTNPHAWLAVTYTDAQGRVTDVDLELGSPTQLVRQGWRPKSVTTGDKVTVVFHPHKDGAGTGFLNTVKLPNGSTLSSE